MEYTQEQFKEIMKTEDFYNFNYGGFDTNKARSINKCPIFKTYIPYKSWTIIVDSDKYNSAENWCDYFLGSCSVSKIKKLPNEKIAIRADYQCW
jgi:hypothetical protein